MSYIVHAGAVGIDLTLLHEVYARWIDLALEVDAVVRYVEDHNLDVPVADMDHLALSGYTREARQEFNELINDLCAAHGINRSEL